MRAVVFARHAQIPVAIYAQRTIRDVKDVCIDLELTKYSVVYHVVQHIVQFVQEMQVGAQDVGQGMDQQLEMGHVYHVLQLIVQDVKAIIRFVIIVWLGMGPRIMYVQSVRIFIV